MVIEKPKVDFLEASRKFQLFSSNINVKLPKNRKDRDKALLEYMELMKEMTFILSQIFLSFHFMKDDVEIAAEYKKSFSVQELIQFKKILEAIRDLLQTDNQTHLL
jgi:hypothetical protein